QELMEVDHGGETQYQFMDVDYNDENDYEDLETVYGRFPPGEEGLLQSHAGGEAIFQQIHFCCTIDSDCRRSDSRVRTERTQISVNKWGAQMDLLVDAYLQFKAQGLPQMHETSSWPLSVLSFSETGLRTFSHAVGATRSNQTLLRHGYLGSSPESPAIAFPIEFLEQFRQIHRVCPRYSVDALSKTLNNLHKIPRKKYLRDQLSDAYDGYLAIMCEVEARVQKALHQEDDWHMKNICPPCFYKTVGEPPLKYSALAAMDGNNSLKLVDVSFQSGTPRTDDRKSTSFRWLTPQQVDCFKDEVVNSKGPVTTPESKADQDEDIAWLNINELEGAEADELAKCVNICVERWRAAGPEARKKMFALFAIAGIFLSVCRHGHVLVMCDMIRSGELYDLHFFWDFPFDAGSQNEVPTVNV
ncbi:hypothetical protein C8R44DRAFT_651709, partial [Mycena epipterygia]